MNLEDNQKLKSMNADLKYIKKKYGENMMHFCRDQFSSILEHEGLLPRVLSSSFNESKALYNDIVENKLEEKFINYIKSLYGDMILKEKVNNEAAFLSPKDLLASVGYDFYECHTQDDIESFRKYYAPKEELCTFGSNRLSRCHVFWAVKKDVEDIKREDFLFPSRQDRYGTSVISIQFSRNNSHYLSIKNRYNHTVANPDATFSNNLDNIVPGLTKAFEQYYGLIENFKKYNFEIPNYVVAQDGKFYKYNIEVDNVYFCPDNIMILDGKVLKFEKEKYIIFDNYIIDLVEKKIVGLEIFYGKDSYYYDGLLQYLHNINRVDINNIENGKSIVIDDDLSGKWFINVDNNNQIVSIKNNVVNLLPNNFMRFNSRTEIMDFPEVRKIGNNCFRCNREAKSIEFAKVLEIGENFMCRNKIVEKITMPLVQKIDDLFLISNTEISQLNLPNLVDVGDLFLLNNKKLRFLSLPNVKKIGSDFLSDNDSLNNVYLYNVLEIGDGFLASNKCIKEFYAPKVTTIGSKFLLSNNSLEVMYTPSLKQFDDCDVTKLNQWRNNEKTSDNWSR